MSKDKIAGFMWGLGAGFIVASILGLPDEASVSRGGMGHVDEYLNDEAKVSIPTGEPPYAGKKVLQLSGERELRA